MPQKIDAIDPTASSDDDELEKPRSHSLPIAKWVESTVLDADDDGKLSET